ncbi:hypothetical protein G3V96_22870 [Escherichia coli]|nr:hypothetical protein [Escherichia coli]
MKQPHEYAQVLPFYTLMQMFKSPLHKLERLSLSTGEVFLFVVKHPPRPKPMQKFGSI